MGLVIAWRNPFPPDRSEKEIRRFFADRFGTLYRVTGTDTTQECFELNPGGAARNDQRLDESEAASMPACQSTAQRW
jgi:hypothetical protein